MIEGPSVTLSIDPPPSKLPGAPSIPDTFKAKSDELREYNKLLNETASSYNAILAPVDAYNARIELMMQSGASFARAQGEALHSVAEGYGRMATDATGALRTIFGDHKGLLNWCAARKNSMPVQ